jgi:hypothetical protein
MVGGTVVGVVVGGAVGKVVVGGSVVGVVVLEVIGADWKRVDLVGWPAAIAAMMQTTITPAVMRNHFLR